MISIVDNYGEGIPVAWALANRVDTAMLVEFLKPIRERIGPIKTDILCQIWQNNFSLHGLDRVFGSHDTKRLFCSWHVDKSWKKGLNEYIEKKQNRVQIYQFRILLQVTNEARFQVILQQLLSYLLES